MSARTDKRTLDTIAQWEESQLRTYLRICAVTVSVNHPIGARPNFHRSTIDQHLFCLLAANGWAGSSHETMWAKFCLSLRRGFRRFWRKSYEASHQALLPCWTVLLTTMSPVLGGD